MAKASTLCALVIAALCVVQAVSPALARQPHRSPRQLAAEADAILAELKADHTATESASLLATAAAARANPQDAIAAAQQRLAAADTTDASQLSMIEATARTRAQAAVKSNAAVTAAAAAAAADAAAYHYDGHSYTPIGVDPCAAACERVGGWRDYQCQDCIFHGLVNGWLSAPANARPRGYNYNQWSRDYCVAYAAKTHMDVGFSQCFLDQIQHAANL